MATTIEKIGARVYLIGLPFDMKDQAKETLGMTGNNFDRDRRAWWVGAAKIKAAEEFVAALNAGTVRPAEEDLNTKRVYAKVTHNGRTMYVIGQTLDADRLPLRVRLAGFAPEVPVIWADAADCKLEREYHGREVWDGRRGNGKVTVYTTLGSLRSFVADQKRMEADGVPQCAACHKRSNHLIEDHEDGLMKCKACCDIPSE